MPSSYIDLNPENGYGEVIERLVEAKKAPIEELKERRKQENLKIEVLQNLSQEIQTLDKYSSKLYGFESVFLNYGVESSGDGVSATATRKAREGEYQLEVLSLATSQKIASKKIQSDLPIKKGKFTLAINQKPYTVNFSGGYPNDLVKAISRSIPKDVLQVALINVDGKNQMMTLSAMQTGKEHTIKLLEDKNELLQALGVFKINNDKVIKLVSNFSNASSYQNQPLQNQVNKTIENITLPPNSSILYHQDLNNFSTNKSLHLQIAWKSLKNSRKKESINEIDKGMSFSDTDTIHLDELTFSSPSIIPFANYKPFIKKKSHLQ